VLDAAGVFDATGDALADLNFVFATTARRRELTKPVMTPERAMQHARELIAQGQKVGVMFGPERAGLTNDDIRRANAIVSVPVNPDFPSLNLAQCVLLTAYEWRRQGDETPPEVTDTARTRFAERIEVDKLIEHYETRLDEIGFFWPETKAEAMRMTLRNMFSRLALTQADVQTLHGILRALTRRTGGS